MRRRSVHRTSGNIEGSPHQRTPVHHFNAPIRVPAKSLPAYYDLSSPDDDVTTSSDIQNIIPELYNLGVEEKTALSNRDKQWLNELCCSNECYGESMNTCSRIHSAIKGMNMNDQERIEKLPYADHICPSISACAAAARPSRLGRKHLPILALALGIASLTGAGAYGQHVQNQNRIAESRYHLDSARLDERKANDYLDKLEALYGHNLGNTRTARKEREGQIEEAKKLKNKATEKRVIAERHYTSLVR